MSGMTGAGRSLKASSHAGFVLENVCPYKVGAHQHVPEIAQALGLPRVDDAASSARTPRPDRDVLRALHRSRSQGPARGAVRGQSRRHRSARRNGARARAGSAHRSGRDRRVRRPLHRPDDRDLCEDNLGKGAAGQAIQNVNALSASTRRAVSASPGSRMSRHRRKGLRRLRCRSGYPSVREGRSRGRALRGALGRGRDVETNRVQAA